MSVEENKALFRRWIEVMNEGNWTALDDVLSADFAFHNPTTPMVRTREDYRKMMSALYAALPPGQWTIDEMFGEGDKVVGWLTFRGVHSATYRGIGATGREVVMEDVTIARFAGGRIVEAKALPDSLGLLVQIGAIPAPGQPTK